MGRPRVALFLGLPFHRPILGPIADALGGRAETIVTGERAEVVGHRPDAVVMAALGTLRWFRHHLPGTLIGSVRHGLLRKGMTRRLTAASTDAGRRFDFLCVGDEEAVATYRDSGASPTEVWWTGYPQLDPLFRGPRDPPDDAAVRRRRVLYAPTWNEHLSSGAMLGSRVAELIRGPVAAIDIVIKPHPAIPVRQPGWIDAWRTLTTREPGVTLADPDADVMPFLLDADVLVSDASSVVFEFLALDRPIVLLTNPAAHLDPAYEARDIIWRWRDVGIEVSDVAQLRAVVEDALRAPERGRETRRAYADRLFGPFRDGRNAERVADRLVDALERRRRGAFVARACDCDRHGLAFRLRGETIRRSLIRRTVSAPDRDTRWQ